MAGTIRERRPGVWQIRAYAGRDSNGRPIQVAQTVQGGKRDAEIALAKLVTEVEAENVPLDRSTTVGVLLDRWLAFVTPLREPGTVRGYATVIRRIKPVLGHIKVAKLGAQHLETAYRDWQIRGLSSTTVHHCHAVLAAALHQAVRWGTIPHAATDKVKAPPMASKPNQILDPADVRKLIDAAEADYPILSAAIFLAALTGCRRGELCALRWSDVDGGVLHVRRALKHGVDRRELEVRTTKTRQERKIALDEVAQAVLAAHRARAEQWASEAEVALDPDGYILSHDLSGRTPEKPDTITEQFRSLAKRTGVKIRFHDLRHFSATTAIAAGADIRTVAGRLGHSDPSLTLRIYAHAVEARDKEVASILGRALQP